jgi:spore germination cell wall hydrolase CwlJ-like protein
MKYAPERPYSDPETAGRRLLEHAHAFEAVQDGRIYVEVINGALLFGARPRRRNMARASDTRSSKAGWNCTKAERL